MSDCGLVGTLMKGVVPNMLLATRHRRFQGVPCENWWAKASFAGVSEHYRIHIGRYGQTAVNSCHKQAFLRHTNSTLYEQPLQAVIMNRNAYLNAAGSASGTA